MNGPESVRTDGTSWGDQASMMAPLLREWILLREREIDLVRRIADLLEQSSRDRTTADGGPEAAVETGAGGIRCQVIPRRSAGTISSGLTGPSRVYWPAPSLLMTSRRRRSFRLVTCCFCAAAIPGSACLGSP